MIELNSATEKYVMSHSLLGGMTILALYVAHLNAFSYFHTSYTIHRDSSLSDHQTYKKPRLTAHGRETVILAAI